MAPKELLAIWPKVISSSHCGGGLCPSFWFFAPCKQSSIVLKNGRDEAEKSHDFGLCIQCQTLGISVSMKYVVLELKVRGSID